MVNSPPSYDHLRTFDCLAYVHISQGKLNTRAKKGIFLGYSRGVKGYRIWLLDDKKCIISRDVNFYEKMFSKTNLQEINEDNKCKTSETLNKSQPEVQIGDLSTNQKSSSQIRSDPTEQYDQVRASGISTSEVHIDPEIQEIHLDNLDTMENDDNLDTANN